MSLPLAFLLPLWGLCPPSHTVPGLPESRAELAKTPHPLKPPRSTQLPKLLRKTWLAKHLPGPPPLLGRRRSLGKRHNKAGE